MINHLPGSRATLFAVLAALASCLAPAAGQAQTPPAKQERYQPIPFQGNFETLFKNRLQTANDDWPLLKLIEEMRLDPAKFKFEPADLDKVDLNNPALRRFFQDALKKHESGTLTPAAVAEFRKLLAKPGQLGKLPQLLPKNIAVAPPAPPRPTPGQARSDAMERWLRDWVKDVEQTELVDWLRDSQAFREGMADLQKLIAFDKDPNGWGLVELPAHLRLVDNFSLGAGWWQGITNLSLPELPTVNLPRINVGGLSLPNVPLPSFGRAGGGNIGETLLWAAIIAVSVVLAWQLAKGLRPRAKGRSPAELLGPWPVDPAAVSTRAQLVQAFDYLAVLLLGTDVRTWNHRAIAERLGAATTRYDVALELAELYEQARYTAGAEPLDSRTQTEARRGLCMLAGR